MTANYRKSVGKCALYFHFLRKSKENNYKVETDFITNKVYYNQRKWYSEFCM